MRRTCTRRGGIQHGVQKHKITSRRWEEGKSALGLGFEIPPHILESFYKLANWNFNVLARLSCALCLLSYEFCLDTNELRPASVTKIKLYYCIFADITLSMIHKLAASVYC